MNKINKLKQAKHLQKSWKKWMIKQLFNSPYYFFDDDWNWCRCTPKTGITEIVEINTNERFRKKFENIGKGESTN